MPQPNTSASGSLEAALAEAVRTLDPAYLEARRWYGGKGRGVRALSLVAAHPLPLERPRAWYCLVGIDYADGGHDVYAMPLTLQPGTETGDRPLAFELPDEAGARLAASDAVLDPAFNRALYDLLEGEAELPGGGGALHFRHTPVLAEVAAHVDPRQNVRLVASEQSNSSIIYSEAFILKLFRRLEEGPNPDLEVLRFLTEHTSFRHSPRIAGYIERQPEAGEATAIGALQTFVANEGDGWRHTLQGLADFYAGGGEEAPSDGRLLTDAATLGRITGELHAALATGEDPAFAPEAITLDDTRSWVAALDHEISETLGLLREVSAQAPEALRAHQAALARFLDSETQLRETAGTLHELAAAGSVKTRYHGDYHLGQVLVSGEDFIILDFEGEPARTLRERRAKYTPLRDVAGMLRSLSYAAAASVFALPDEQQAQTEARAQAWEAQARAAFLDAYRRVVEAAPQPLLPADPQVAERVLHALELEKALYELRYELRNRPAWLPVPLRGITKLLEG